MTQRARIRAGRADRRLAERAVGPSRALVGAAWLVGAWLGPVAGCGESNQDACHQFVAKADVEYRRCGYAHLTPDREETCPEWMNLGGADCTAYYGCLERHATCVDGEIDFPAMEACTGCR